MRAEPATLLVVEIGSIAFFFLLLPFVLTIIRLPTVWQADRGAGLVLTVVVLLSGFFFVLFIVGLIALTFGGV